MSTERRGDTVAEVKKYKVRYLEGGGTVKRIAVGLVVILEPDCLYKERGGRGRMARGKGARVEEVLGSSAGRVTCTGLRLSGCSRGSSSSSSL